MSTPQITPISAAAGSSSTHGQLNGVLFVALFAAAVTSIAQVVGAASNVRPEATRVATIVKMTRVMLLVPVLLVLGVWLNRSAKRAATGGAHEPSYWVF